MNKISKIILILSIIIFGIGFLFVNSTQAINNKVQFDLKDIFVDFNGLPFDMENWAPGASTPLKTIAITNDENFDIDVYFKATTTSDNSDNILANALIVTIDNKSNYLSYFFDNNISLTPVNSEKSQNYDIIIKFDENAGNKYQDKFINFDFIIIVKEIGKDGEEIPPVIIPGGWGGGYITTTTTTPPGEVAGEATKREFFEESREEELPETTTTTTTTIFPSKFIAGISTVGPFSCPVNLTIAGIHPLLASLLCLGQGMCDSLNPWIILLLGIGIIIITLYLAAIEHFDHWIAFILILAVLIYLLLFVLGICLSPWIIFIIGLVVIIGAFLTRGLKESKD